MPSGNSLKIVVGHAKISGQGNETLKALLFGVRAPGRGSVRESAVCQIDNRARISSEGEWRLALSVWRTAGNHSLDVTLVHVGITDPDVVKVSKVFICGQQGGLARISCCGNPDVVLFHADCWSRGRWNSRSVHWFSVCPCVDQRVRLKHARGDTQRWKIVQGFFQCASALEAPTKLFRKRKKFALADDGSERHHLRRTQIVVRMCSRCPRRLPYQSEQDTSIKQESSWHVWISRAPPSDRRSAHLLAMRPKAAWDPRSEPGSIAPETIPSPRVASLMVAPEKLDPRLCWR